MGTFCIVMKTYLTLSISLLCFASLVEAKDTFYDPPQSELLSEEELSSEEQMDEIALEQEDIAVDSQDLIAHNSAS